MRRHYSEETRFEYLKSKKNENLMAKREEENDGIEEKQTMKWIYWFVKQFNIDWVEVGASCVVNNEVTQALKWCVYVCYFKNFTRFNCNVSRLIRRSLLLMMLMLCITELAAKFVKIEFDSWIDCELIRVL